jgi:hypothetical protein
MLSIIIIVLLICSISCDESSVRITKDANYYEGYYRGYFAGFNEGQNNILDWKVFTDDNTYYVLLPPDWISSENVSTVYINSPKDSAYITVGVQSGYTSIDECVAHEINYMETQDFISNFTIISDTETEHQGLKARIIEYTFDSSLNAIPERYCKSLTLMVNGEVSQISFYVQQKQYSSYEKMIDTILNSYHPLWDLETVT